MKNNEKTSDELTKLGEMKSKFESKVGIWDSKVNCDEIQKINKLGVKCKLKWNSIDKMQL